MERYLTPFLRQTLAKQKVIAISGFYKNAVQKVIKTISPAPRTYITRVTPMIDDLLSMSTPDSTFVIDELIIFRDASLVKKIMDVAKKTGCNVIFSSNLPLNKLGIFSPYLTEKNSFTLYPLTVGELLNTTPTDILAMIGKGDPTNLNDIIPELTDADIERLKLMKQYSPLCLYASKQSIRQYRWWWNSHYFDNFIASLQNAFKMNQIKNIRTVAAKGYFMAGKRFNAKYISQILKMPYKQCKSCLDILMKVDYLFSIPLLQIRSGKYIPFKKGIVYSWNFKNLRTNTLAYKNLLACHLQKYCQFWNITHNTNYMTCSIRGRSIPDVDFAVTQNGIPIVVLKISTGLSKLDIARLRNHFPNAAIVELVWDESSNKVVCRDGHYVICFWNFLSALI